MNNGVPLYNVILARQWRTAIAPYKPRIALCGARQSFAPLFKGFSLLCRNNMFNHQAAIEDLTALRI